MRPLPRIMVAPNGAYKTKSDHPNLPVTIEETVSSVEEAYHAGAILNDFFFQTNVQYKKVLRRKYLKSIKDQYYS